MKRGQISIFLILGVAIIGFLIIYFGILNNSGPNQINPDTEPIYNYVEDCLLETGEEALYFIGQSGGYVLPPEPALEDSIAFYLHEETNHMPTKEVIEEELSLYVEAIISYCLFGFEDFPDYEVNEQNPNVKTTIDDEKVSFDLSLPLSIKKGDFSYTINNFKTELPIRLGTIHKAASDFMTEQMIRTNAICINCLYDISETYELKFGILDTNQTEQILFVIRDEKSRVYDEDYIFYFVNKLNLEA